MLGLNEAHHVIMSGWANHRSCLIRERLSSCNCLPARHAQTCTKCSWTCTGCWYRTSLRQGHRQAAGKGGGRRAGAKGSCRIRSVVSSRPFGQVSYSQSIRKQLDNIDCCCCCCDLLLLMCLAVSLDLIIAWPLIRTHLALKQTQCESGRARGGQWQTEIARISIKTPKPT